MVMRNKIMAYMIDVFLLSSLLVALGSLATGDKEKGEQIQNKGTVVENSGNSYFRVGDYFPYLNKEIKSEDGQLLGRVHQIVFGSDGWAEYAVISYRGKLIAVPWKEGRFRVQGDHVASNLDKSRMDQSPNLTEMALTRLLTTP